MKISSQTKLPEWIAIWARQALVFAELIRSHPEVAERLHAFIRFCEVRARLPVAPAARAAGYPQSTLYAWEGRFNGDPAKLAASQDGTATHGADAGGAGDGQGHARPLRLGHR